MCSLFPDDASKFASELLPPSASDRAARRRLTKSEEKETIIINRSGRSTYPEEKSVRTSGATPEQELEATRRRLIALPQALNAVLETARALRRTPDAVSVRDVTDFGGSN